MDPSDIVHLESYRRRRETRFRRTVAFHALESDKSRILEHLWRAASLIGGDRSAVVWLDEYGPGLAHPHTLLDLATDRPRRLFSPTPLRTAWDTSVPGLLDLPRIAGRGERLRGGVASSCSISLGSDGPRSWFLVVDSLTPRPPLTPEVAGELMFVAGEITSVVLHRDLEIRRKDVRPGELGEKGSGLFAESESFSGWPVLRDLEGRTRGDEASDRIGDRFLVARVVRGLVEDELVADPESVCHQVDAVRGELGASEDWDEEREVWVRVLEALAAPDREDLTASVLEWGRVVEGQGHLHGAQEILSLAYELAKSTGSPGQAADAARFLGKVLRTKAEWDQALAWYGVAKGIAEEAGIPGKMAAVLDGLANAYRDRGNLPRAREVLHEVLGIGRESGDRYATAIGNHDLMTVEKLSGDLVSAIHHGWLAVQNYDSREGSLRALFDLSGVLRESGELSAAKDGYSVVAHQVRGFEYRLLSLDALAFIAALQRDAPTYRLIRERMESEGWRDLSPVYLGQVLFYRGLSSRALGWHEDGRKWLEEALSYAERHALNKLIFDAEEALSEGLSVPEQQTPQRPTPQPWAPEPFGESIGKVRRGLRELREALADAESP